MLPGQFLECITRHGQGTPWALRCQRSVRRGRRGCHAHVDPPIIFQRLDLPPCASQAALSLSPCLICTGVAP